MKMTTTLRALEGVIEHNTYLRPRPQGKSPATLVFKALGEKLNNI